MTTPTGAEVRPPRDALLHWVTTRAAVLGALGVLASLVLQRLDVTVGVAVGVAAALGNFWVLRRLASRMTAQAADGRPQGGAAALFGFKFLFFIALLYGIVRFVPVDLLALMAGLSVVVVAILAGSVLGPPVSPESERGD